MDPAVRNREPLRLSGDDLHLRSEILILHRLDLPRFVVRAAVAADEVRERLFGGGEGAGEAVDEDSLHQVAGEEEVFAFAENLRGRHLQVDDSRIGRSRGGGGVR